MRFILWVVRYLGPNLFLYEAAPQEGNQHGLNVPFPDALHLGITTRHVDVDQPVLDPRLGTGLGNPSRPVRVRASNPFIRVQVSMKATHPSPFRPADIQPNRSAVGTSSGPPRRTRTTALHDRQSLRTEGNSYPIVFRSLKALTPGHPHKFNSILRELTPIHIVSMIYKAVQRNSSQHPKPGSVYDLQGSPTEQWKLVYLHSKPGSVYDLQGSPTTSPT